MKTQQEFYLSTNGDRWFLCRGDSGDHFVLHAANLPSGGATERIEITDFLSDGRNESEHQALRQLLGKQDV